MWKNDQAPCNWKMLDKKQASQAIHIWKGGRVMEEGVSYFGVLLFMIMISFEKRTVVFRVMKKQLIAQTHGWHVFTVLVVAHSCGGNEWIFTEKKSHP